MPDIDLGGGTIARPVHSPDWQSIVGYTIDHDTADGRRCSAMVMTGGPDITHEIVSTNPLTISPSLICPECGAHGHVERGAWKPV